MDDIRKGIIETSYKTALVALKKNGGVTPMFTYMKEDWDTTIVAVDPRFMASEYEKEGIAATVAAEMQFQGAYLYTFLSEIWVPSEEFSRQLGVIEKEQGREAAEKWYYEEYQRRGWSSAKGGGRDEYVSLLISDIFGNNSMRMFKIVRYPNGKFKDLLWSDEESTQLTGRFVNLIKKEGVSRS